MKNHNPIVVLVGADRTSNGGIASVIQTYLDANDNLENPKFELIPLKTSYYKDRPKIFELWLVIKALCKFIYLMLFKKISLVHIHMSGSVSFYRKSIFFGLSCLFGIPTIVHIHASTFYEFYIGSKCIRKKFQALLFNRAHMVIVLNKDWKSKLESEFPRARIRVVHNPIHIGQLKPIGREVQPKPFKVLFMGFFIESKGMLDLLEVIEKTANDCNIQYLICGKGELEGVVVSAAQDNPAIKFFGWVTGSEKKSILKESDLLFLPSYKEGLPIIILEAMSYSIPIVSTRIAGIPEEVDEGRNGRLMQPGDVNGFTKAIRYYSGLSVFELNRQRSASFEKVQMFAAEKIYEHVSNIYSEILAGK